MKIGFAALTKHLYRSTFARKKREAQNLLAFDHSLKSGLTGLSGDDPSQLNEAADVIRNIGDLDRRRLPQLPLRKSQRLEARLSARQPCFRRARLSADMGDPQLRLAHCVLWFRGVIRGHLIAQ